jgi:DNA polymerase III delta prime subunit
MEQETQLEKHTLHERMFDEYIWGLKFRPRLIDELVLPPRIKNYLNNIIKEGRLPNMLLSGPAGTGKSSTAIVLAGMLDLEYLYINASEQTGIDVLRTNVRQFITNKSWDETGKVVILDEFDRASPQFQDALKSTLEQFSKSCSFIFISNHKNKIIAPLQSRLQTIEFKFTHDESAALKKEFFKNCLRILKLEKVEYSDKVVAQIVKNVFPDMRKILNELQKLSQQGMLNDITAVQNNITDVDSFFKIIKNCKFKELLVYVAQLPGDPQGFYSSLYDNVIKYVESDSVPDFVVLLGKYSYESVFVVDSRINITSFSTEIMRNCKIKETIE